MTQPALTRAIQKLEHELGGPLFRRERNLTQLTELGRLMRPLLEQTLAAAEAAKEHAARFRKSDLAALRIGLPPTISARFVVGPVKELTRCIPHLELGLKMAEEGPLIEGMLRGEIDLAYLSDIGELPPRLNTWLILKESFCIAFAKEHRFCALDAVAFPDLDGETLLVRRGCRWTQALRDLCAETGISVQLSHVCESEEHLHQLAASGLGVLLVPEHQSGAGPAQMRPLRQPRLARSVVLAAVGGRRYSPGVDAYIKLARARDFAADLALI